MKRGKLVKIGTGIFLIIVLVIAVNIISANRKMKLFEREVDEFLVQWDGLI